MFKDTDMKCWITNGEKYELEDVVKPHRLHSYTEVFFSVFFLLKQVHSHETYLLQTSTSFETFHVPASLLQPYFPFQLEKKRIINPRLEIKMSVTISFTMHTSYFAIATTERKQADPFLFREDKS